MDVLHCVVSLALLQEQITAAKCEKQTNNRDCTAGRGTVAHPASGYWGRYDQWRWEKRPTAVGKKTNGGDCLPLR